MAKRTADTADLLPTAAKGRGTLRNPAGRFEPRRTEAFDDGWLCDPADRPAPTVVRDETAKSALAYNDSPDLDFDRTLNPYRGCEHGCVYCYARPSHGFLGLSAGLDFETQIFAKPDAPEVLDAELRKPAYQPRLVLVGANTDAWQPAERQRGITRRLLEKLLEFRHPFGFITKSALIVRDRDLLAEGSRLGICRGYVSVTSLDAELQRKLEPRTASPQRRLEAIAALAHAGVQVGVMAAPMIPGLNDHELEAILRQAKAAGAQRAGYIVLRLPFEIKDLFESWLRDHAPDRADRVLKLVRDLRGGQLNSADFGTRMRGQGPLAELLEQRFRVATRALGLDENWPELRADLFAAPPKRGDQLKLW